MPYSSLISKVRCHNPNKNRSRIANKNYLTYIATREGVEIGNVNDIDDLLTETHLLNKDLNDDVIYQGANNENYMRYMANRPRSHGLFGNIVTDDLDKVAKQVSELTRQGKCIYRGIINLWEKDAEALGLTNKESWNLYLNKVMPDIARELGLSYNISWVAAFHAEKSHPHIHYELWDNTDKVKSPYIHTSVQHKIRKLLSDNLFDSDYENVIKEVYKSERDELNKIRNNSRNSMTNTVKDIMDFLDDIPGTKLDKLPSRITSSEVEILSKELAGLVDMLPVKGSVDYAYLPKEVKEKVDVITSQLFERTDLKKELQEYLKAVEDGQKLLGKTNFDITIALDNAGRDINSRIGNIVAKHAKKLKEHNNALETILTREENSHTSIPDPKEESVIDTGSHADDSYDDYLKNGFLETIPEKRYSSDMAFHIHWSDTYKEALKYLYNSDNQDFQKAFDLLKKEASHGNVLAIHDIGKMYEKGLGIPSDGKLATLYYSKALTGFLELEEKKPTEYVEYRIGKMFDASKGTEQNYNEAAHWYQKAADQNYKYAQYSLGMLYLHDKLSVETPITYKIDSNYEKAFDLFHASEKQGNAYAAFELAKMYKTFVNPERSNLYYKSALSGFLSMSLKREDDNLLYRIGKMYYDGTGTEKDNNKAVHFLERASKLNNENAQMILAKLYLKTNCLPKILEAIQCLRKLSEAGNEQSQYALGKYFFENMNTYRNPDEAWALLSKSAEQGNLFAHNVLGKICYANKDLGNALFYYSVAGEKGNDSAQYALGKLYIDLDSVYFNPVKAVHWYTQAAEQGNQYAQYQLGKLYLWGKYIQKDEEKGYYWLHKSKEQGNEFASKALDAYENYKNNVVKGIAFGMIKSVFNTITNQKNKTAAINNDKSFISHSKQSLKEQLRKQQTCKGTLELE